MGRVCDIAFAAFKIFTCEVDVPGVKEGMDILGGIKFNAMNFSVLVLVVLALKNT
jgi:hypothetical protein